MRGLGAIFFITFKNLRSNKIRFAITVFGVAMAVTLILLLKGIAQGALAQATSFIDHTEADLFVVQEGGNNLYQNFSILPRGMGEVLKDIEGVKKVEGVLFGGASFQTEKGKVGHFFFFGLEPTSLEGMSWEIIKGRRWENPSEMVIDRVLAKKFGIKLGEKIEVHDLSFKVVGFSTQGSTPFGSYVFTTKEGALKIFRLQNIVGHFQVFLVDKELLEGTVAEIKERIPDVEVYTHSQFRQNHQRVVENSVIPPIEVMSAISFLVGVAVIGLTLYTSTSEKKREYGIIKAIGARNQDLYQIVLWESLIAAFLGFGTGLAGTFLAKGLINILTPGVYVFLSFKLLIFVFLVANMMSLFASFIPAKLVGRIDPAIAFRE